MRLFGFGTRKGSHEAPAVAAAQEPEKRSQVMDIASPQFMNFMGMGDSVTTEVVSIDSALTIPAVWCAVAFLSETLASLPIKVYQRSGEDRSEIDDPALDLFNFAATDDEDAHAHRRAFWLDVFTYGRGLSFIERAPRPVNLWGLEPARCTVRRQGRARFYRYDDYGRTITYEASEVIDLPFLPLGDRLGTRSPIYSHAPTIGLALAVKRYGAKVFDNGGIPPFVVEDPINTPGGVENASVQITQAILAAARERRQALALPEGHKVTPLGFDPEKLQMEGIQRFLIEEFARIWGLPPVFLQDLTHGTFSNTEQQDLQLVKHCISRWANAFEKQANLKIFGRADRSRYLEHALDGLMRGDLKSRAEAFAQKIHSGQLTPNEARRMENRPDAPGGDHILVQGAMVRADSLPETTETQDGGENAGQD